MYKDSIDGRVYGSRLSYAVRATWEFVTTEDAKLTLEWVLRGFGLLEGSLDGGFRGVVLPKVLAVCASPIIFTLNYRGSREFLQKVEEDDRSKVGWGPH